MPDNAVHSKRFIKRELCCRRGTEADWALTGLTPRSCVMQKDDEAGQLGMKIGRELMSVAGKALRQNITELGPRVLPLSEKLIFAGNFVARKV